MIKYIEDNYRYDLEQADYRLLKWFDGELPVHPDEFTAKLTTGLKKGNNNDLKWGVQWKERNWCSTCGTLTPEKLYTHHEECCNYKSHEECKQLNFEKMEKYGTETQRISDISCKVKGGKLCLELGLDVLGNIIKTSEHWCEGDKVTDIVDLADEIASVIHEYNAVEGFVDDCLYKALESGCMGVEFKDENN